MPRELLSEILILLMQSVLISKDQIHRVLHAFLELLALESFPLKLIFDLA